MAAASRHSGDWLLALPNAQPKLAPKRNLNLNQHASLRTVHMRVRITLHNCRT